MSETTIALPAISSNRIAADLRDLTETLVTRHQSDHIGGGLGGEWGYGTRFANDVFEMNPYNWADCSCSFDENESDWWNTHDHAPTCYQQVIRARGYLDYDTADAIDMDYHARDAHNKAITDAVCAEMGLDPEFGCAVHCTCTHDADYAAWRAAHSHDNTICPVDRPNFHHKPTGAVVNFYKYLGRGMEVDLHGADWKTIIRDCYQSVGETY